MQIISIRKKWQTCCMKLHLSFPTRIEAKYSRERDSKIALDFKGPTITGHLTASISNDFDILLHKSKSSACTKK
jgi:hypothetical protein